MAPTPGTHRPSHRQRPHCPRPRCRGDRGSSTVEAAITVPLVMALLLLVVQAGLYFHTRAVAQTAAHKGLDALRVEHGTEPAARATTEEFLDRNAGGLEASTVDVQRDGDQAEVVVTGDVVSLLFGAQLFPIRVTATAPIEQVTP
jgi:Flp pilus assembly protein TadG